MPPKADYWKHFKVVGVVAECQEPNISRVVDERIQLNIFILFSRYFLSSFSKEENRVAARLLLIERVNEYIQKANLDPVVEKRYRGSFYHLKLSCLLKGHP